MRLPEGIVCFVSLDVPELTRLSVLDLGSARADFDNLNELIESVARVNGGATIRLLDPESGLVLAFMFVRDAMVAASSIQVAMTAAGFPCRLGLTTIQVELNGGVFAPETDDRLTSIREAAQTGQVVADLATKELARFQAESEHSFTPLGLRVVNDRDGRERLFQLNHPRLERKFAETPGVEPAYRLPSALTAFVGRWGEIDRVLERFYFSRAVTICGPAGLGKTRTAIQVAHELVDRQPDGVWFVDLGMIKSGSLVADMILRSLPRRLTEDGPALDSLQKMLADKELLLVLDNVEHVLSEAARVVDALSRSCPNVQFLSTSREPLGIDGESVIRLGPLRTPHPGAALDDVIGSEAMMLLLDRIRIQDPDFEPDLGELGLLAEACREVDGIPLALELVASRMQSMSPRAVLRTLRANRNMAGNRMAHGRHSSLQDALEWGYTSLQPPAQLLFHRVSVFAGGFTLQAAGDVCSDEDLSRQDIEAAIDELHRCSLLIRDSGRYRMLRPLRDFAQEKLRRSEGVEAMRDRHLDWMIELAESAPGQPDRHGAWLSALEPELANAREAMEWARTSSNDDRAFRLAYGLYDFWYPRSMAIEGALEIRRTLRSSRRLDWLSKARLFNAKAVLEMERGDLETALADYQSAARLAKKNGDQMTETRILANIAIVMRRLGKGKEAYQSGDELLRRMPEGEPMWIGQQLNVAAAAMDVGEFEDARRRIEIVFELAVTTRSEHFLGHVFLSRGELATRLGKFDEAQEQLERGFLVFEGLADMRTTGIAIALLIVAVTGAGLHRQAAAYHGCLENLRSEVAVHLTPQLQTALDNAASSLRQALGESEFNLEQDRGRSLGLGDLARHLRNRLGELDHTER